MVSVVLVERVSRPGLSMSELDRAAMELWRLAFGEMAAGPLRQHCLSCLSRSTISLDVMLSLASVCTAIADQGGCPLLRCLVERRSLWDVLVQHYRARIGASIQADALSIVVAHCSSKGDSYAALQSFKLDAHEHGIVRALVASAGDSAAGAGLRS